MKQSSIACTQAINREAKLMEMPHILLIHGTWCKGENWGEFALELERRGFKVHTPSLRHHAPAHESNIWGNAQKVASVGLLDYVADLEALVDAMESPPIIMGHSLGALIAQLLAARRPNKGVVLMGPAPAAGMFGMYPSMIRLWARYMPQWVARKPMYPVSWTSWTELICNAQPRELQESYYSTLCAESGKAYAEMVLWFLDLKGAARVKYSAVKAPVLVITGSVDRCTAPALAVFWPRNMGRNLAMLNCRGRTT